MTKAQGPIMKWEDFSEDLRAFLEQEAKERRQPFKTYLDKKIFFARVITRTAEEIDKLGWEEFTKKYPDGDVGSMLEELWPIEKRSKIK